MNFWTLYSQFPGLTIDPFGASTLRVDTLIEWAGAIERHPHQSAQLPIDIFDTATAFEKLRMSAGLSRWFWGEQGTAEALRAVAADMVELDGWVHTQSFGTARHSIGITCKDGMRVLIERNGDHATVLNDLLIDLPYIKSGISGDMGGNTIRQGHRLQEKRLKVGDIAFVERQGVFGSHAFDVVDGLAARAASPSTTSIGTTYIIY